MYTHLEVVVPQSLLAPALPHFVLKKIKCGTENYIPTTDILSLPVVGALNCVMRLSLSSSRTKKVRERC